MRLLNWNIGIKKDNAQAVVAFVKEINADILCLQEVSRGVEGNFKTAFDS
jgi:exonuclease III